jgi:hypothetical protein
MKQLFPAFATLLAAILAGAIAWWINRAADRRRVASEREERILKALEFLTGGTQSRSAGIGLLEGLFKGSGANDPLRSVFLPVIRNQIIYLSTSSKPKEEFHEHDNFFRLVDLWTSLKPTDAEQAPLSEAMNQREEGRGLEFLGPYAAQFDKFRQILLN